MFVFSEADLSLLPDGVILWANPKEEIILN